MEEDKLQTEPQQTKLNTETDAVNPDKTNELDNTASGALTPEHKPQKKRSITVFLKWFLIVLCSLGILMGVFVWWLFYFRHFNFGHKGGDIGLIKAGIFEGTLNQFAPALDSNDSTLYLNRQMFEGLVRFEDKTNITPLLATSWRNPDPKTWIFTLKDGVHFHTGNILEPKDVVYSYEQYKQNSSFDYVTATIKSVTAISNHEVKIVTTTVDPVLLNRLVDMFIVDSSANGKADPRYGTGPYEQKPHTTATASHIELSGFREYHLAPVHVKEIHVTVYPEDQLSQVTKDFLLGRLNIVGFVPSEVMDTAQSLNFKSGSKEDSSVYEIGFNTKKVGSPVQKLKVRQAIRDAIDVPMLLKAIGRDKTGTLANQVLTPDIPGYNPDIQNQTVNKEEARKLLAEAGYGQGAHITLTVFSAAEDAGREIARQLEEVGIMVDLDVRDDVAKLQQDLQNGQLEAFYYAETTSLLDGSDVLSKVAQTANYDNPQFKENLTKSNGTLEAGKRLGYLEEASNLLVDDVVAVPLYSNKSLWIMDKAYDMPEDTLVSGLGVYIYKTTLP